VTVTSDKTGGQAIESWIRRLLGWSPADDREFFTKEELIDAFSLEGMNKANSIFNYQKDHPILQVGATAQQTQQTATEQQSTMTSQLNGVYATCMEARK